MRLKPNEILAAGVIVVFIVAVIGLGLYPTLREAPTKQCLTNLKDIGTVLNLYIGDNAGTFPPAASWVDGLGDQYAENLSSFVCPGARPTAEQLQQLHGERGLPIGYSLFRPLGGANSRLIATPEKTPWVFDSSEIRPNSAADVAAFSFRHAGKNANVLFCDGHSVSVTAAPAIPHPLMKPADEATPPSHAH